MKFLRVGSLGKEIPAILDNKNKIRDLTSIIRDLTPDTISFKILEKIKEINIENLPELKNVERTDLSQAKERRILTCLLISKSFDEFSFILLKSFFHIIRLRFNYFSN